MPIYYNGTEITDKVTYNGYDVNKINYNGVEVWGGGVDQNTLVLLHFDGSDNNLLTKNSGQWGDFTRYSGVYYSSEKKFGDSCLNAYSGGMYLRNYTYIGDATIEFWFHPGIADNLTDCSPNIYEQLYNWDGEGGSINFKFRDSYLSVGAGFIIRYSSGSSSYFSFGNSSSVYISNKFELRWYHFAFVLGSYSSRQKYIKLYIDGTLVNTTNCKYLSTDHYWAIGGAAIGVGSLNVDAQNNNRLYVTVRSGSKNPLLIDDFRISNIIRYTENFTPPTAPFKRGK